MQRTLLVVEPDSPFLQRRELGFISFDEYLREYPKLNAPRTRVINLCDSSRYLGRGYYCSLLAEARRHPVIPSVRTLNGLNYGSEMGESLAAVSAQILQQLLKLAEPLLVCVGKTSVPDLGRFASKLFVHYPAPLLSVAAVDDGQGVRLQLRALALADLSERQTAYFLEQLETFVKPQWRLAAPRKQYRWDMAILVNPLEPNPPSDKAALSRFVKAAAKQGIRAELLQAEQLQNLSLYDALFIRETTAIDHHSYKLAARAEQAGLVVMDDPVSILRCCNKVFLHDAFSYQKIPAPRTDVVNSADAACLEQLEQDFGFPMVLKMPESAFSKGVYKVHNREELASRLQALLEESALVLVQEYLYTGFDWRVGVLNNRAIYACKYQMARGHWQIYNHGAKRNRAGGAKTLPTFEVPRIVLDAAVKAARIIGNGLYGVDLKEKDGRAYVIEVNDNPSIDRGVEDGYLGDELYMQVMAEFKRRLEARGQA